MREAEAKSRDLVHEAYAERERVRREMARLQAEEAEFRLRLRSLLGAILEAVRDHEERLAGAADRRPRPRRTRRWRSGRPTTSFAPGADGPDLPPRGAWVYSSVGGVPWP